MGSLISQITPEEIDNIVAEGVDEVKQKLNKEIQTVRIGLIVYGILFILLFIICLITLFLVAWKK